MKNDKNKAKTKTETAIRLKNLRKSKNMTGSEVASAVGLKDSTYRRYETTTNPPADILTKLAAFFGVTVDYLLNGTELPGAFALSTDENGYKVVDSDIGELSEFEIMALKKLRSISDSDRRDVAKYLSSKRDEK